MHPSDVMTKQIEALIKKSNEALKTDGAVVRIMEGLCSDVLSLWNGVLYYMDIQISALEDQVEHDFWDKPRNPVDILHEAQRISRNLAYYRNQISFMENDLRHSKADDLPTDLAIDLEDVKSRFETLVKRTDKAVPALLASIAIGEGKKASSLTAVALWFAPLSLSASIVSIDGGSRFGGQKYWIWACIAVPLLLVVILVANLSDKFIEKLGRRGGGRALVSIFKPETRIT